MSIKMFEYCCGIAEIGNFDDMPNLTTGIPKLVESAREDNKGAVICTTVGFQREAVAALKAAKFEPIAKFHNPNTDGTTVTVWFKTTQPSFAVKLAKTAGKVRRLFR